MNFTSSLSDRVASLLQAQRLPLVLVLLVGSFIVSSGQVSASSNISTSSTSSQNANACTLNFNFDGAELKNGWGATAMIGGYQPKMFCSGISAWSMILDSSGNGYAQIGYLRNVVDGFTTINEDFIEYTFVGGGDWLIFLGADSTNWGTNSNTFRVYYDSGDHYVKFLLNGVYQSSSMMDWSAVQMEWFAETHASQDQVVGGYNHHSVFSNVGYLNNGVWHPINAQNDVYNDNPNGGLSTTTSGQFWVWDKRVS